MSAILGICLDDRLENAVRFQKIITEYGCSIRTRIGLHNTGEYNCANKGIILLEVTDKVNEVYDELSKDYSVQVMRF